MEFLSEFLSWLSEIEYMEFFSWLSEHLIYFVPIVGIIIWGILAYIYSSRKLKKRAESLKEFLPQQLIHSLPNENLISKFREPTGVMQFSYSDDVCRGFLGRGTMNLMEGNMGSIDFVTYDYEYTFDDKTFRGTAILLQSVQLILPSFKWGPKGVQPGSPPKAKEEAGSKQCPTCGSLDVRGGATIEGGGIGDWCPNCKKSLYKMNEEKAHKLIEFVSIANLSGLTALASNTQLLLYQKSMVPVEKYQEFKEKALKIFQMFQSASQNLNKHALEPFR